MIKRLTTQGLLFIVILESLFIFTIIFHNFSEKTLEHSSSVLVQSPPLIASSHSNGKAQVFIYNRVPKSASTYFTRLLLSFSRSKHQFRCVRSWKNSPYRLSVSEQNRLKRFLERQAKKSVHQRLIYDRHFHFIPFQSTAKTEFFYFNLIRDPVERALSHFNYQRYVCVTKEKKGQSCTSMDPSLVNMTMDQCISKINPIQCISKSHGVRSMLSFYCGHHPICDDSKTLPTSSTVINMAKENIERYYLSIGLLESLPQSLELFEVLSPDTFRHLKKHYEQFGSSIGIHRTARKFRRQATSNTSQTLRQLLQHEYELYQFIRQRFVHQYNKYFHKSPIIDWLIQFCKDNSHWGSQIFSSNWTNSPMFDHCEKKE